MKQHTLHRAAGANRRPRPGFFPPPALTTDRADYRPDRSLSLSPPECRDRARLAAIGRVPVLERTPADNAFEDAFEIGLGWPTAGVEAIEGLFAGLRAALRRAGHPQPLYLSLPTHELDSSDAAAVGNAIVRGVEL